MTKPRMYRRLAQLNEYILDKAAAQDKPDHAKDDRCERHRRAAPLSEQIAQRES